MRKPVKTAVWAIIAIVFGYFFLRFIFVGPKVVPAEFTAARGNTALLAAEIGLLSNATIGRLDDIRKLDKEFDYNNALVLISGELIKNKELSSRPPRLPTNFQSGPELGFGASGEGQGASRGSHRLEVAMVSQLINYNNVLKELLNYWLKYTWRAFNVDEKANSLVDEINNGARAINSYNEAASATLAKFMGNQINPPLRVDLDI